MDGPWHIDIRPWQSWVASTGGTPTRLQGNNQLGGGSIYTPAPAIGQTVGWDVPLTAGTWSITVVFVKYSDKGIVTLKLDSTTVGTFDTYNAGVVYNSVATVAGVVVATDAVYRLSLNMLTKYVDATNYDYSINHIALSRTA